MVVERSSPTYNKPPKAGKILDTPTLSTPYWEIALLTKKPRPYSFSIDESIKRSSDWFYARFPAS